MNKQRKILIVDDSKINLTILAKTFEERNFVVYTASNVEAAQTWINLHQDEINLVLSDIQMPGLSGFDLVRWAKAQKPSIAQIPILLITSQLPEPENRIFGLSIGAVDYVLRSLNPEELVLRVERSIENFIQVRSLQDHLQDAEKVSAAARVLAATHHEIKNLAQVINGMASIAFNKVENDETIGKRALNALKDAASTLAEITKSMSNLHTPNTLECVPVEIGAVMDEMARLMTCAFKGVYLEYTPPPEKIWVHASKTQLKQILLNLLLNAREAVRESNTESGGCIRFFCNNQNQNLDVIVEDNGIGFSKAETRTEFPAFATTRQLRGGNGLGLWLSANYAKAMSGSISLTSEGAGQGVQAKLTLSQVNAPAEIQPLNLNSYLEQDSLSDWRI